MNKESVNTLADRFADKYGEENALKAAFSSIIRILVENNIVTEEQCIDAYVAEVKSRIKEYNIVKGQP